MGWTATTSQGRALDQKFIQTPTLRILHAFVKKKQKTPPEAIELALKRAKELGYL